MSLRWEEDEEEEVGRGLMWKERRREGMKKGRRERGNKESSSLIVRHFGKRAYSPQKFRCKD